MGKVTASKAIEMVKSLELPEGNGALKVAVFRIIPFENVDDSWNVPRLY